MTLRVLKATTEKGLQQVRESVRSLRRMSHCSFAVGVSERDRLIVDLLAAAQNTNTEKTKKNSAQPSQHLDKTIAP